MLRQVRTTAVAYALALHQDSPPARRRVSALVTRAPPQASLANRLEIAYASSLDSSPTGIAQVRNTASPPVLIEEGPEGEHTVRSWTRERGEVEGP
ncbi:hypothetical protein GCM10010425_74360 [Streptomyces spororaveus]|uniref:Uncharacterized protein n=1 Tax=Streptomyces spororaveus TaxID=284039 RepID=A0ABQ3T2Q4_9ACTN|nr:hypothetical protein Sspor_00230 [Streptomyces spororaveus]